MTVNAADGWPTFLAYRQCALVKFLKLSQQRMNRGQKEYSTKKNAG